MLKVGDLAPSFTTTDHTGKSVSLADFRGKTVVLWFFPKADTPGCTAEGCSFRDLSAEFAKKKAVIFGVSFDDAAANSAFHKKYRFTFALLCDVSRALGMAYGAADSEKASTAKRIGIVIDSQGRVAGFYPKVDPKSFATDVLAQLPV